MPNRRPDFAGILAAQDFAGDVHSAQASKRKEDSRATVLYNLETQFCCRLRWKLFKRNSQPSVL